MNNLPEIVIAYNRFLDPIFTAYIQSHADWKTWTPPTKEEIDSRIKNYREEWKKYEQQILEGVCNAFGLCFKQNIIYIHIVGGNPRPFSNPIVLKSGYSPEEFVAILMHELIHNLLRESGIDASIYEKLYPNETRTAGVHAVVHAVMKYVYVEILRDEESFKNYIIQSRKAKDNGYARSWDIVESQGYQEIIKRFKEKVFLPISK